MKIINASQVIKPEWNGWKFYENVYHRQTDSFMLTGHKGGHENTKLFHHKIGGGYKPVNHKWCNDNKIGLEDPHVSEKAPNGYYYMSCEAKPFDGSQLNIMTFKSKTIDASEWIFCSKLTLKPFPKPHFNYSLSSPVNVLKGNDIIQYYEGRGFDWNSPLYQTRPSYAIIDTTTDTIKYNHKAANIDANVIPDDVYKKDGKWWYSLHEYNTNYTHPLGHHWFGIVYSSNSFDSGFKKEYIQTLNGDRVGEIYFTNTNKVYFWKDNPSGMWQGELETNGGSQPPDNGGNNNMSLDLIATSVDSNRVKLEWNHPAGVNNVHFERKGVDGNGKYFATRDVLSGGEYTFLNTWNATEFRARPENSGTWESWVKLDGGTVNPDPDPDPDPDPNPDIDVDAIKQKTAQIRTLVNEIDELCGS